MNAHCHYYSYLMSTLISMVTVTCRFRCFDCDAQAVYLYTPTCYFHE